MDRVFRDSYLL